LLPPTAVAISTAIRIASACAVVHIIITAALFTASIV
jgi:hypothetical protein